MRRFLIKHKTPLSLAGILFVWRIYLLIIETARYTIPFRYGYLGFIPQANFDGVYYLAISQFWYRGLDQAFFPLYPIIIGVVTKILSIQPAAAGIIVSTLSTFLLILTFHKLLLLDGMKKYAFWSIIFLLSFPTSFFLVGIYTEGLFMLLVMLSFYLARRGEILLSSCVAGLASATRVVGIFLLPALFLEFYSNRVKVSSGKKLLYFAPLALIPLGLIGYMFFLWVKYSDPLLFMHIQPAFGAGRSGGNIVLLPQVIYRYFKIIFSVSINDLVFWVAAFELFVLFLSSLILFLAYKRKINGSYILFSLCVLLFPTLSGTLSSLPRYALASFAMFIYLSTIKSKIIKITLISAGLILEGILASLFMQGYFVS